MEQQSNNKGGRPRKEGRVHKYIVPPRIEQLAKEKGIDYVWNAAIAFDNLMNKN